MNPCGLSHQRQFRSAGAEPSSGTRLVWASESPVLLSLSCIIYLRLRAIDLLGPADPTRLAHAVVEALNTPSHWIAPNGRGPNNS